MLPQHWSTTDECPCKFKSRKEIKEGYAVFSKEIKEGYAVILVKWLLTGFDVMLGCNM